MAEKRAADIGSIEPIEQNLVLGATSRGLAALRDKLGYVPLPDVLGGDLGHALLGQSPEEIEKWSYGHSPFLDPHYTGVSGFGVQPSRAQGLMDVGFLPVGESLAVAKLGTKGLGALASKALEEGALKTTDAGRRQFLKSAGAAGAAGVVGAKVLPKLLEEEGEHAAKNVASRAAKSTEKIVLSPHDYHKARTHVELTARNEAVEALNALPENIGYSDLDKYFSGEELERIRADIRANSGPVAARRRREFNRTRAPDDWDTDPIRTPDAVATEKIKTKVFRDAYDKTNDRMLNDLHKNGVQYSTLEDLNHAHAMGDFTDHEYTSQLTKQGWLPDADSWIGEGLGQKTVEDHLHSGKSYIDPFTGNEAILNPDGTIRWTNGVDTSRYQHWLPESAHEMEARERLGLTHEYDELSYDYKSGGSIENTTHSRKII